MNDNDDADLALVLLTKIADMVEESELSPAGAAKLSALFMGATIVGITDPEKVNELIDRTADMAKEFAQVILTNGQLQ